ncbi:hypothetical protein [Eleftheria terrae]|uniref:hypothetical protein n=1 Tax=Eleftheria terrae TaxID=1597781 RepID=UPI00263B1A25|nr:hypothetical protein [Eleftheria terrae]WKB55964.1 hypothetical protein N7L95_28240 [Eleftheria terrae]
MDNNPYQDAFRRAQQAVFSDAGGPGGVQDNLPLNPGPTAYEQAEEQRKRKEATTAADTMQSIWRQDGFADGLIANYVGRQLLPDPNYSPFQDAEWKELSEGVWEDLRPHLYEARSAAHAQYIKSRLLDKQEDLTRLGDLGGWGTAGRFAVNAVLPDQLLVGMVGGWAARAAKVAELGKAATRVRRASGTGEALAAAENLAGATAQQAASAGTAKAMAIGVTTGAAGNAAIEKLRQSVNFEDDMSAVLAAGLLGAAITTPFAAAGLKAERRIAETAWKEHAALKALHAAHAGEELTPLQARQVDEVVTTHQLVRDIQAGRLSASEAEAKVAELEARQASDDAAFMQRLGDKFAEQSRQILEEMFPGRALRMEAAEESMADPNTWFRQVDDETAAQAEQAFTNPDTVEAIKAWARANRLRDQVAQAGQPRPDAVDLSDSAAWFDLMKRDEPETGEVFLPDELREKLGAPEEAAVQPAGSGAVKQALKVPAVTPATPHDAPAGFIARGSIGSAQASLVDAVADQATALAHIEVAGKKVPIRFDIFAKLNSSENPLVRRLAFSLVKDPIAVDKEVAQGWTASEWKSHLRRTVAGQFFREAKEQFQEAARVLGLNVYQRYKVERGFYEMVTRVTRGDETVLDDNPQIAPMLRKASAAQRKVYETILREAKKVGVKGADGVDVRDFYVNRQWDIGKIRELEAMHGKQAVIDVVAGAIQVPGLTGDTAKAARFLQAVKQLEFSPVMQDILLGAQDMGTLRSELKAAGLAPSQVDSIVDTLFEARGGASDAGQAPNLKFRFDLDENFSIKTEAGTLKVSDLLENDSRVLVDAYVGSMGGHVAAAKVGIRSRADWAARTKEVTDWFTENPSPAAQAELRLLNDIYANITGRPMSTQDFSTPARMAAAIRGYTRSVMLGQLGLAATFEMMQAVSVMGFRAFVRHVPSLSQFTKALRAGHVPDAKLARDIQHIAGFGNELAMTYMRNAELEPGFMGAALSGFERGAHTVSHAVDILSGNASMTSITRQFAGRMAVQRMHDLAMGLQQVTPKLRERFVAQGIDADYLDTMLGQLRQFSDAGPGGTVRGIEWEAWQAKYPETYEKFQLVLSREVRDAVQDQDLGETMPFMHTTIGKIFGELKTFMLVAHAKNFLKQVNFADETAIRVWVIGFVGNAMAYMTQNAINYAHDPAALEDRLSPERIGQGAFFRMASAGVVPALFDTGYGLLTGGDSLVQPGTTTNTDTRNFLQTPSLTVAGRLMSAPATLAGMATGSDVTTKAEMRSLVGALPGSNLYGVRNLANYLVDLQPATDPEKGR